MRATPGVLPAAPAAPPEAPVAADDDDGVEARGGRRDGEEEGVEVGVGSRPASRGFLATADMIDACRLVSGVYCLLCVVLLPVVPGRFAP